MEQAVPAKSNFEKLGRTVLWFLLHLAIVYLLTNFLVLWLTGQFHNVILPLIGMPPTESRLEFAFNHLLLFSVLCGLLSGAIAASYNPREAQFVWIIPTIVLAFKFVTFPSSLLENHFALAFHHYFGGGFFIPEYHSYHELFANFSPDYLRGLDQNHFTAPIYVSVAYSFSFWAAARLGIRLPMFGTRRTSNAGPSRAP